MSHEEEEHLLVKLATSYKRAAPEVNPEGHYYDHRIGAWISVNDGTFLIRNKDFAGPKTKKADVETGEDQKGE